jgi:hypothetical protein
MTEIGYSLFLIIIYISLIILGSISVFLYRRAYLEMKRTKMILSVYLLLISLLIENIYFGLYTVGNHIDWFPLLVFSHPILWAFPKLFVLISLTYFIYMSVCINEYVPKKK